MLVVVRGKGAGVFAVIVAGLMLRLGACDATDDEPAASDGTTDGPASSGDPPELSSTTGDEPAPAPPPSAGARVIYIEGRGEFGVRARFVDDSGERAAAPTTLLEVGGAAIHDPVYLSRSRRWAVLQGGGRMWLVELEGAVPGAPAEIAVELARDAQARIRISDDDRWMGFVDGAGLHLCALAPGAACEPETYNPPPQFVGEWLDRVLAFDASGRRFVYLGNITGDGVPQVILGAIGAPGEATVLASLASEGFVVFDVRFAPGDETLYFTASVHAEHDQSGLYAVDLTAEVPLAVRISEPISEDDIEGGTASWARLAPDLGGFLWHAPEDPGDLWWVSLDGARTGEPVLVDSRVGRRWDVSPDGRKFLFTADHEGDGVFELYHAERGAMKQPIEVGGPLAAGEAIVDLSFLPDSSRVLYQTGARALWLGDSERPGVAVRLDAPGGAPAFGSQIVLSDSSRMLYAEFPPGLADTRLLRHVSLGEVPGGAVDITPLPAGPRRWVERYQFSDDGGRVYCTARSDGHLRLYRIDLGGPEPFAATELSGSGERVWGMYVLPPGP